MYYYLLLQMFFKNQVTKFGAWLSMKDNKIECTFLHFSWKVMVRMKLEERGEFVTKYFII